MLSTMLSTHLVIAAVGSDSNGLYVEVLAKWDLPSATYVERSFMTMQLKSVCVHFAAGSKALRDTHAVTRHNWHD